MALWENIITTQNLCVGLIRHASKFSKFNVRPFYLGLPDVGKGRSAHVTKGRKKYELGFLVIVFDGPNP